MEMETDNEWYRKMINANDKDKIENSVVSCFGFGDAWVTHTSTIIDPTKCVFRRTNKSVMDEQGYWE